MKSRPKQTTKATKKTTKTSVVAKTSKKTVATAARKKRASKNTLAAPPARFKFLCDCMTGFAVAVIAGTLMWWSTPRRTQVLGVSTKLDTSVILEQINMARAERGIGPLTLQGQLTSAAHAKGENMFSDNYWAHVNPTTGTEPWSFIQEAGYEYQSAGENLGRDFGDERSLVDAWMASPSHQENILNPAFSDVGLAVLDGQIDGEPVVLIVNLFGQPKTSGGKISQRATYNYNDGADQMVLAGQIGPTAGVSGRFSRFLSPGQIAILVVVGVGITLVLGRLQPVHRRVVRKGRHVV